MNNREEIKKNIIKPMVYCFKTVAKVRPSLFVLYIIDMIMKFASTSLGLLMPKFILDEIVLIVKEGTDKHLNLVILYVIMHLGISGLMNLVNAYTLNIKSWMQVELDLELEVRLTSKSVSMSYEYTEDPKFLDKLQAARDGISWYSGGVVGMLNQYYNLISNIVVCLGVNILLIFTCPVLILIQAAGIAIEAYFNYRINRIELEAFSKLSKANRLFGYFFWDLSRPEHGKDIRLYESKKMMADKADEFVDGMCNIWSGTSKRTRRNQYGSNFFNTLKSVGSYLYVGVKALMGLYTIGNIQMLISACNQVYESVKTVAFSIQEIVKKGNYFNKYLDFLEIESDMKFGDKLLEGRNHTIEFKHVYFKYPRSEEYVLKDINITLNQGEHLSVVGLNGAGKTTFIKLLCRLYDVTEGEILLDGCNINLYSESEYRKLISVIFQDFQILAFSLRENIALTEIKNTDENRIVEVLKRTGLYEDAMSLKCGLDTNLTKQYDRQGTQLSGGQSQKVAICRALYKDAGVVILDEPTAALDPVAEYEIYRQFEDLVGGKTAVYISHRLSSCQFCDKIAVFSEGTIKEYGTHAELVKLENGIYAEMFMEQAKYYNDCGIGKENPVMA